MIIHKHTWIEISRTYAKPPELKNISAERASGDFMNKLFLGVTTILWECMVCQELRKEELLGKELRG